MSWVSQKLLTAIGEASPDECITEARMVEITGMGVRQVEGAVRLLRKHEFIETTGKGCHKLTSAGKEALTSARLSSGPKGGWSGGARRMMSGTLRERIWRAMGIRRKFTIPDLVVLAVDGTESGDVTSGVQKYVRALAKAGYLVELPRREPCKSPTSPGFKRWWLQDDKYTGPKAPVVRLNYTVVYDPNTEKKHVIGEAK
jgi:hypothetical protein